MTVANYLKRIGYTGVPGLDFTTLHDLQRLHLMTVPYENLDIMREVSLSLELEDIYEKIVTRGRGGYCFELNALFAWLLRSIGFKLTDCMARFLRDEPEIPMRRHRVLIVKCDTGNYLCDVGVGGIVPREPLPLVANKVSEQNGEKYMLKKDDFLGHVLYEWRRDEWRRLYSFTEEPQIERDFAGISFYCEKYADSFFRTQDMVHIFTDTGRKSVAGREIRLFSPNGVKVLTPATEDAYHKLLREHFSIKL